MKASHRRGLAAVAVAVALATTLAACDGDEPPRPSATPTTTAPPGSTTAANVAEVSGFVAFGDFGGGPFQDEVAEAMTTWAEGHRVDALVTTGDNVYDFGAPELFDAQLDAPYAELRARRPMWATLGNHDVSRGHGDEQLEYLGLPDLPYEKALPGVQLLFLDGNRPNPEQAEWLDTRLAEPGPPFRVVVLHQPAYSCSTHGPTPGVVTNWVPVFERHRVALVLSGHDHLYERFTSPNGVEYVVTGGGGKSLYPFKEPCQFADTVRAHAEEYHFVGVEAEGGTMTVTAVSTDGAVLDTFEIRR